MIDTDHDEDDEKPRRLSGCVTGMCGALDCPNCMGESNARAYLSEMEETEEPQEL